MKEAPKSIYNVFIVRNMGLPKGRESYGNGVLIVVVGVTSPQGERESRLQGEVEQVEMAETEYREHSEMRALISVYKSMSI